MYFLLLVVISVLLVTAFGLMNHYIHAFTIHETWWLLPVLFAAIAAGGHTLMIRSVKAHTDQFMIWFLLAISLKMLLYLGVLLLLFVMSGKILGTSFLIAFAVNYVAVTILDLVLVLRLNKNMQAGDR